jgi:hypothetical protein
MVPGFDVVARVEVRVCAKDRTAMLSESLLMQLREWYRQARAKGGPSRVAGSFPGATQSATYRGANSTGCFIQAVDAAALTLA